MKNEDIGPDTWKQYPNNHGFHLRCDLKLLKDQLMETVEWIVTVPSARERVRLLTELKDGVLHLVNLQGSWFSPGLQQLRYAAIYDNFVEEWRERAARDAVFQKQWGDSWGDAEGEEQWEEHHGRSWYVAWHMTSLTGLNVKQIKKVVTDEAHRRRQEANRALREHERQRAEERGVPRPVREING